MTKQTTIVVIGSLRVKCYHYEVISSSYGFVLQMDGANIMPPPLFYYRSSFICSHSKYNII